MSWVREHEGLSLALVWLLFSAVGLLLCADALSAPGMFYDEAWLAQQGREFVEPGRAGSLPSGAQSVELFGRTFPLFALPYLGSLKSQLLMPWFFAFGNELGALRMATMCNALLALLATMFAVRRAFNFETAVLSGLLLVSDPTVFFHAQWEWAPFTTGWLCRAVGAVMLLRSYQTGGRASACAGAFALGLSGYNRADSVLILASLALGLLAFHRAELAGLWRDRRSDLYAALAAFLLGALPILLNIANVFGTVAKLSARGDFAERIRTLLYTLDGSYPHRLMEVGGRFDAMHVAEAPFALLGVGFVLALVSAGFLALRGHTGRLCDGRGALAISCLAIAASGLALEGATRAHHALNIAPFVHVFVAASLVAALREAQPNWTRVGATACGLLLLGSNVHSIGSTRELLERTGGRGWWSSAISELANDLDSRKGSVAVSLDWGFHLPLLFLTDETEVIEPIWGIERAVVEGGAWETSGDERHRYVAHEDHYDRFGYGPQLLHVARILERSGKPVAIQSYRDREGEAAFVTIAFGAPHRIVLRRGTGFRVEFDERDERETPN